MLKAFISIALVLVCAGGRAWAADAPAAPATAAAPAAPVNEDIQKQNEFRKLYTDKSQPDHMKALAILDGSTSPTTWELLIAVVRNDPNKDVRFAAFKRLCAMPARTPKLAETLGNLFDEVKPSDADARTAFASEMGASEFKYAIYEQMVDYGSKMGYPDLVTGGFNNSGNSNGSRIKFRKEFEAYIEVFNKVTGASITAKDRGSPATIRDWWKQNKDKILVADREKATKYAVEDSIKNQPKENPLLPKKAQPPKKEE